MNPKLWLALGLIWLGGFLVGFGVGHASAAPLEVRSHQANLYGGRLAIAEVTIDKTVRHPTRATVYVNGLSPSGDDGDWPQLWHVRLHRGRNKFGKTFFVRHWDRVVPGYVGRPDRWTAGLVGSVYSELSLGAGPVAHASGSVAR